jgi:hypothetical protein
VFDYDNDGRFDLLTVDMHSDMWLPATVTPRHREPHDLRKKYAHVMGAFFGFAPEANEAEKRLANSFKFRYEEVLFGNSLYHKLPSGKYEEVSDKVGLETFWPWGIATGDFDNDGSEDVFLPSGMGYPYAYWPNALMMNNGSGVFTDRAAQLGVEPPANGIHIAEKIGGKPAARSSRCAVTADFDGDGRLELLVNNFNSEPYYFKNHFAQKKYVAFRLRGTVSNRDAIGAVVKLQLAGGGTLIRQVHAAGGYLSQSSRTLHFGLGDRTAIESAEIVWPSGIRQQIAKPDANKRHDLTEPAK